MGTKKGQSKHVPSETPGPDPKLPEKPSENLFITGQRKVQFLHDHQGSIPFADVVKSIDLIDVDATQLDVIGELLLEYPYVKSVQIAPVYHTGRDAISEHDIGKVLHTDFLAGLDTLETVFFGNSNPSKDWLHSPRVTSVDFDCVSRLPHLKRIIIQGSRNLRYLDLSPLSRLQTLEEVQVRLYFGMSMLRRINLSGLNRCPSLKGMYIEAHCLDGLDLSPLDGSPSLQELVISGLTALVSEEWDEYLNKDTTDIITTPIDSPEKMTDLKIPRCESLREVQIGQTGYSLSLLLPSRVKMIDLTNVEHDANIRTLWIHNQGITELDLSPFQGHRSLSSFALSFTPNLSELDLSPLLPMGHRLFTSLDSVQMKQAYDSNYRKFYDIVGKPITYRASRDMQMFYPEFKANMLVTMPRPYVRGRDYPHPGQSGVIELYSSAETEIEWY
jgi:hypothetical protein